MKKISKILSIVLVLSMLMGFALVASAEDAAATLSFADVSNRTSQDAEQQVWEANGIVFTNDKASSTTNVADYSNPVRLYKGSDVTIEYPNMTKIVITANSASYAGVVANTSNDANVTAAVDGSVVTYEFASPVDSFTLTGLSAQTRFNELSVYAGAAGEEPEVTTNYYVAGEAALCGSNWDAADEANIMTKGEDGLYTKVYENVPADEYELKVTVGNWDTCWGDPTSSNGNYFVTVEAVSTVTVIFDATACSVKVDVVPNEVEPDQPSEVVIEDGAYILSDYMADGTQVAGKTQPATSNYGYLYNPDDGFTTDNVETQYILTHVADGNYTIADCNGRLLGMTGNYTSFNYYEAGTEGNHVLWNIAAGADGKYIITNVDNGKIFDYSDGYNSFGAYTADKIPGDGQVCLIPVEAKDEPEVTTNYYVAGEEALCGSNWDAADEANIMTKGEDGLYTKVYKNVLADEYELKVTVGNWDTCWGDPTSSNGNYFVTVEAVSTVTVIFNADTHSISVEVVPAETEPEEPTIDDIAAALAGENGAEFTIKGVVTCIDGKNVYVMDATGAICLRAGENVEDLVVGDTVIGTGSKSVYNGLPQLSGSYEKSEGAELVIKETTIGALTASDICTYIKLSGVTVTEVFDNDGAYSSPNVTVSDGTNTIQIYKAVVDKNEDGTWAIKVGDVVDVYAAVSCYNDTLQLRNTYGDEFVLVADEQPENPGEGEVNPGTGDMAIAGLVVAMMAATAGAVVLKKKEF